MRDPFHPERELLTAEEASKQRADLDQRWEDFEDRFSKTTTVEERLTFLDEMNELMLDGLFMPWEADCPILAEYLRRKAA